MLRHLGRMMLAQERMLDVMALVVDRAATTPPVTVAALLSRRKPARSRRDWVNRPDTRLPDSPNGPSTLR